MHLISHKNSRVRFGCVMGLSGLNDDIAISGLIKLNKNDDFDVRNWATFGLASQCEVDTGRLRNALFERLTDHEYEIRGEALIGLARRNDHTIQTALMKELNGAFNGSWAIQAVTFLARPEYLTALQQLKNRLTHDNKRRFIDELDEALLACSSNKLT